jgi:tRNA (cytidine/uridine-2'-O-)-methyltransferase
MVEIVLVEPEIPSNTGNVMRLCANTGFRLHLVRPLGFSLRDAQLKRAGLDYRWLAEVVQHEDWAACRSALTGRRLFAATTRAEQRHDEPGYADDDIFVFGSETRGLSSETLVEFAPQRRIRIPMRKASRSLNLSNAVAVVIYEAWRQLGFTGGA